MAKPRPTAEEQFGFFDLPIIFTPLTRITDHWGTAQKGPCAAREIDWARCASRIGEIRARTECKPYLDDFLECARHPKAIQRYLAMQHERKKQGREFLAVPPKDSVWTAERVY